VSRINLTPPRVDSTTEVRILVAHKVVSRRSRFFELQ
jgi:hypothetical protein